MVFRHEIVWRRRPLSWSAGSGTHVLQCMPELGDASSSSSRSGDSSSSSSDSSSSSSSYLYIIHNIAEV